MNNNRILIFINNNNNNDINYDDHDYDYEINLLFSLYLIFSFYIKSTFSSFILLCTSPRHGFEQHTT